jgi:hypothetical protein
MISVLIARAHVHVFTFFASHASVETQANARDYLAEMRQLFQHGLGPVFFAGT